MVIWIVVFLCGSILFVFVFYVGMLILVMGLVKFGWLLVIGCFLEWFVDGVVEGFSGKGVGELNLGVIFIEFILSNFFGMFLGKLVLIYLWGRFGGNDLYLVFLR